MLESIGLGGILTFDAKGAMSNMAAAEERFKGLEKAAGRIEGAFSNVGGVALGLGAASAGVAAGIGVGTKVAADFEQALANIRAAAPEVTAAQMSAIATMSKDLGARTSFTATEAAQGMNELVKAGMSAKDAMSSLPGVLAAAEAEGMQLADAATIVSQIMSSLGEKDSQRIADTLAAGSAASISSIRGLGEAFTYGAAGAKKMGLDIGQATAVFGALSNAGLDASMAGTSFSSMVNGLISPTDKAAAALAELKVQIRDGAGNVRPFVSIIDEIKTGLAGVADAEKRAAIEGDLFTNGAERAYSALASNLNEPDKGLASLLDKMKKVNGEAARMQSARMDTLTGDIEKTKSAMEGLVLEVFGPALPMFRSVAAGIGEGIDWLRDKFLALPEGVRNGIGTAIAVVGVLASVFAVVAVAVGTVLVAVGSVVSAVSSLGLSWAMLAPFVIFGAKLFVIIGLVVGAIYLMRDAFAQVWSGVTENRFLSDSFSYLAENVMIAFGKIRTAWNEVMASLKNGATGFGVNWQKVGNVIGTVFSGIVLALTTALTVVFWLVEKGLIAVSWALRFLMPIANILMGIIGGVVEAISAMFDGRILDGLKSLGVAFIDVVLMPIRLVAAEIVALADALGRGNMVSSGFRTFAEKGVAGFVDDPRRTTGATVAAEGKAADVAKQEAIDQSMEEQSMETVKAIKAIEIKNETTLKVDGKKMASSVTRHNLDVSEREGAKTTPWTRRRAIDHGAVAVGG